MARWWHAEDDVCSPKEPAPFHVEVTPSILCIMFTLMTHATADRHV